jgi:hypothetical protein
MVARLPEVVDQGSARSSRLSSPLVSDSSRMLDVNNTTASEASNVSVFPQLVCRFSGWCGALRLKAPEQRSLLRRFAWGQVTACPQTCVAASFPEGRLGI